MEATDSTAGNGYEQHREHRVGAFAGRIKGGECRQLHGRLINCDTNQSECDAGIQQEGVQDSHAAAAESRQEAMEATKM